MFRGDPLSFLFNGRSGRYSCLDFTVRGGGFLLVIGGAWEIHKSVNTISSIDSYLIIRHAYHKASILYVTKSCK